MDWILRFVVEITLEPFIERIIYDNVKINFHNIQ
jgi:hypothetical protein